jgi:RING finger protein 113A
MFRKPKKAKQAGQRRKKVQEHENDEDDEEDKETSQELLQARKRAKMIKGDPDDNNNNNNNDNTKGTSLLMHQFETSKEAPMSHKEMATRVNELHPTEMKVDRGNQYLAGPIKAPTNIRTTCRFDYQPDICKDYKDTGFCGFGDTCIYLHDRGDTMSGWQIEQQWEEEQAAKKKKQQEQLEEFMGGGNSKKTKSSPDAIPKDGLPFACHFCREAFTDPVVTSCSHYFCQACILKHVQELSNLCPICNKDTHGVFNQPTKLLSKKRKLCGRESTWQDYQEACQQQTNEQ